jgi:hypothetical protein
METATTNAFPTFAEAEYRSLVARVRNLVASVTPPGSVVLVASKGDESLATLPGRRGWHFPRGDDGGYAGYYPADSEAAVVHLEALRANGAEYLVLPATAFWWLDHYDGLAAHLESRYAAVVRGDAAIVYALGVGDADPAGSCDSGRQRLTEQIRSYLSSFLPDDAVLAVASSGDGTLLDLGHEAWHFPRDPSGGYAGNAGSNTSAALNHADELSERGASFLVVPHTDDSWLEAHPDFLAAMATRRPVVASQEHLCTVFDLNDAVKGEHE